MTLLFLLAVPVTLVSAVVLVGRGLGAIGRHGVRSAGRGVLLRGLAEAAAGATLLLYAWGMLHVASAVLDAEDGGTDSSPIRPCRTEGWAERQVNGAGVADYKVDYIPLRFVCETYDGGTYATDHVPGYLDPAVLGMAL